MIGFRTCVHFMCMYVCMYVCSYVRMYVCMYVRMYVCMYVYEKEWHVKSAEKCAKVDLA